MKWMMILCLNCMCWVSLNQIKHSQTQTIFNELKKCCSRSLQKGSKLSRIRKEVIETLRNSPPVAEYDKCSEQPRFCENGATCEKTWTSTKCHCHDGYHGDRCNQCPERFQGDGCQECAQNYYGDNCGNPLSNYSFNRRECILALLPCSGTLGFGC